MSRRIIHIEGLPRSMQPPEREAPAKKNGGRKRGKASAHQSTYDDFDYQCNLLRQPGDAVRFRNDYWQSMAHKINFSLTGVPYSYTQIVPARNLLPDGCGSIWLVEARPSGLFDDAPERVWALTVRQDRGGLLEMFIRAGLCDIDRQMLPVDNLTQIVSQNVRPLTKIRFSGTGDSGYFVPERNFCYIGHQYR